MSKTKKYSLTQEELSDYMFYFRLMKEEELKAKLLSDKVNWTRLEILKRNGVDFEKYNTDWSKTLEDGVFTATQKDEQKLPEKQVKGNKSKK